MHELLTFKQNCVTVDANKYVLSERDDPFYAKVHAGKTWMPEF